MNKKAKATLLVLSILVILSLLFIIKFSTATEPNEIIKDGKKIANNNGLILSVDTMEWCTWKPDDINDGYKICGSIIEVLNNQGKDYKLKANEKFIFDLNKKDKVKNSNYTYYWSSNYTLYNKTLLNESCINQHLENCSYQVERRNWYNWKNLATIDKTEIQIGEIIAVKVVYEIPQYESAFYNFTLKEKDGYDSKIDPDISACGDLNTAGATYTLTKSITTSSYCFNIINHSITLDFNGYNITGNKAFGTNRGIDTDWATNTGNLTIKNGLIYNFSVGVLFTKTNNKIINMSIISNNDGLYMGATSNSSITDCFLSNINRDVYLRLTATNNTFTNVSYNISKEIVEAGSQLIRKWYFNPTIKDLSNNLLNLANVTGYNISSSFLFSELTNANGKITRQELFEYINTGGTRTYQTPHTFNVSKTNYVTSSTTYNLTQTENILEDIFLTPEIYITIINPEPKTYNYNESLPLDFIITNFTEISSCWFYVEKYGNGLEISNTTIINCQNTTFNISQDGTYTLYLWLNDTSDVKTSDSATFSISTVYPAINLLYPTDNSYLNYKDNIYFNFTAVDEDGLSTCQLWGNWTGTWHKNYTWINPANDTMNYTTINLTEGNYKWNVWCNDSLDNGGFYFFNNTLTIDETKPKVNITTSNGTTVEGLTFVFEYNISDLNLDKCYFTLRDSNGNPHNYPENSYLNCSETSRSLSTLLYGKFTIEILGIDLASNNNTDTITFTNKAPAPTVVGGGGGASKVVDIISFTQNKSLVGFYTDLDLAKFYAEFFKICTSRYPKTKCTLSEGQLTEVCGIIVNDLQANQNDCSLLYSMYLQDLTKKIQVELSIADKYGLIRDTGGIRFLLEISPLILDQFWIKVTQNNIGFPVTANKPLKSCEIIEPANFTSTYKFECKITGQNTTGVITLTETDPKIFSKVYTATIGWTAVEKDQAYFQNINVRMINVGYKSAFTFGLPLYYASIGYLAIIGLLAYLIGFNRVTKRLKRLTA